MFKARYAPGTLTAVAYDATGREVSRRSLQSAEGAAHVAILPEQETARPGEILYVPIQIVGENGVVESNADRQLTVSVQGGELLAYGSANPCTEEQYHTGTFTTYYGRSLAIVRAGEHGTVTVSVDGADAHADIPIR